MTKELSFANPPEGHIGLLVYDDQTDKWYAVLGDSDGHIILEVASITLPDGLATSAKQLGDGHNVAVSNMISGFATETKQLADGHNVAVSNMISGFATETKQLADGHNVAVSNMISGFATSAKQLGDGHGVTLGGEGLQVRRGNYDGLDYDAVPGDTDYHTLCDQTNAGTLEWLSLASNHAETGVRITLDGATVSSIWVATPATYGAMELRFLNYGSLEDGIWKLFVYDTENNHYGLFLKKPLWFNTSIKVEYHAGSAAAKVCVTAGLHLF